MTVEIKKQRHKGTNKTRTVKRTVPAETFFTFFSPPQPPKEEDEEDVDEEALDELEEKLEADYAVGELIKEKFIPRAVDWFTGKALDYEDNYDEDDEDEGDYDEFEGGEGDEDEEDDEDDDGKR